MTRILHPCNTQIEVPLNKDKTGGTLSWKKCKTLSNHGRRNRHWLDLRMCIGGLNPHLAIELRCRAITRDMSGLATFVADFSSSVEGPTIGCSTVARNVPLNFVTTTSIGKGYG